MCQLFFFVTLLPLALVKVTIFSLLPLYHLNFADNRTYLLIFVDDKSF